MSPEMLLQQGHNYRMDWWCLGLLMHERITGKHPFHGNTHYDTLRNMVTKPPNIDARISPPAAQVIKALLIKNPRARLGGKEGLAELQRAPFLAIVSWDLLFKKQVEMPYRPKVQDDADVSSFETTFTKEKPVDSVPENSGTGDKKAAGLANNVNQEKKKGGVFSSLMQYATGTTGTKEKEGGKGQEEKQVDQDAFRDFGFKKAEDDQHEENAEEGREEEENMKGEEEAMVSAAAMVQEATQPRNPNLSQHSSLLTGNKETGKMPPLSSSPLRERPAGSSLLTEAMHKMGSGQAN